MTTSIRKLIDLPDYVTLLGAAAGMLAMLAAIERRFSTAAVLMLCSVACDYSDGKIARLINRANPQFGAALDALTDVLSFGVAPVIFGYSLGLDFPLAVVALLIFAGAVLLRLARFLSTPYSTHSFTGMPVTYNSVFIPLIYLGLPALWWEHYALPLLPAVYLGLSALMVSSIRWIKF